MSAFENIVFNIAQTDYPDNWSTCVQEVVQRLQSNNPQLIISGMKALKNIMRSYEFEIDEDRKPLFSLVEYFFPHLEVIISSLGNYPPEHHILFMQLCSKIFYIAN